MAIADTCGISTSCGSYCAAGNDDFSYLPTAAVIAASNTCTAAPVATTSSGCDIPSIYCDFFSRTTRISTNARTTDVHTNPASGSHCAAINCDGSLLSAADARLTAASRSGQCAGAAALAVDGQAVAVVLHLDTAVYGEGTAVRQNQVDIAGDGDAAINSDGIIGVAAVYYIPAAIPCGGGAVYHVDIVLGMATAIFVPILYAAYCIRQGRRQLISGRPVPRRFKAGGIKLQGILIGQFRPRLANGFKLGLHLVPVFGGDVLRGRECVNHGLHPLEGSLLRRRHGHGNDRQLHFPGHLVGGGEDGRVDILAGGVRVKLRLGLPGHAGDGDGLNVRLLFLSRFRVILHHCFSQGLAGGGWFLSAVRRELFILRPLLYVNRELVVLRFHRPVSLGLIALLFQSLRGRDYRRVILYHIGIGGQAVRQNRLPALGDGLDRYVPVQRVKRRHHPFGPLGFRRQRGEWEQTDQHRRRQETSQQSLFHGHNLHIKVQKFPSVRRDVAPSILTEQRGRAPFADFLLSISYTIFQSFTRLEHGDGLCWNFHGFFCLRVAPRSRGSVFHLEGAKPGQLDRLARLQGLRDGGQKAVQNRTALLLCQAGLSSHALDEFLSVHCSSCSGRGGYPLADPFLSRLTGRVIPYAP